MAGVDLVREMFRIADGEALGYDDPVTRGHSIEFRINAEDPGRGFLPGPGTVTRWQPPYGPGRPGRLRGAGRHGRRPGLGLTAGQAHRHRRATRKEALQRAARALGEFEAGGLATALSFDRVVVTDPAFAPELYGEAGPFQVHTRWIETEFRNEIPPWTPDGTEADSAANAEADGGRQTVVVEVGGKRLEVTLPATLAAPAAARSGAPGSLPAGQPGSAGRRQRGRAQSRRPLGRRPDRPPCRAPSSRSPPPRGSRSARAT